MKWYVGIRKSGAREAFASTNGQHGNYASVLGPFRTPAGAIYAAEHPHVHATIPQFEKEAKRAS